MKKLHTLSLVGLFTLLAVAFSGCASKSEMSEYPSYRPERTNFLGLVKTAPGSYDHVSPATFDVSSSDLVARDNFSGDKVELFWGAFTFTDY